MRLTHVISATWALACRLHLLAVDRPKRKATMSRNRQKFLVLAVTLVFSVSRLAARPRAAGADPWLHAPTAASLQPADSLALSPEAVRDLETRGQRYKTGGLTLIILGAGAALA